MLSCSLARSISVAFGAHGPLKTCFAHIVPLEKGSSAVYKRSRLYGSRLALAFFFSYSLNGEFGFSVVVFGLGGAVDGGY